MVAFRAIGKLPIHIQEGKRYAEKTEKLIARNTKQDQVFIVLMLLPAILLVVMFIYYPFLSGVPNAFKRYSLLNLTRTKWIGLKNFRTLFRDPNFLLTIPNTIKWVFVSLFFSLPSASCWRCS